MRLSSRDALDEGTATGDVVPRSIGKALLTRKIINRPIDAGCLSSA
jgi:hypothetical protein